MNLSTPTLARYERGQTKITLEFLERYCELLGVHPALVLFSELPEPCAAG